MFYHDWQAFILKSCEMLILEFNYISKKADENK